MSCTILSVIRVAFLGSLVCSSLMAQGRIVGLVFDDTESVIPGADITATHEGTNVSYSFQSNESGKYEFPSLPVGPYTIRAELAGFKASEARVIVETAQVTQQDFTLQIGNLQDTVTVSAEAQAPLLQAESPEIGQVITNRQILELPLNGRNFEQLALLSTGVTPWAGNGLVVMNGARPGMALYQIDNVSTNTILDGRNQVRPSIETIQEFKLQSSTFSAKDGRAPGIVTVTTRSGNNKFHGNVFNFFRNDRLSTYNFFQKQRANPVKSPLNRNQFGTTFGGPVVRNKNFFFSNFEGLRQYRGLNQNIRVPTGGGPAAGERNGDFTQTPGVAIVMDLMARLPPGFPIPFAPFPNNTVPASRHHPAYQYFKDWWPEPNDVSGRRFIASPRSPANNNQFSHRADHHFSSADRLWGRFWFAESDSANRGWGSRPNLIGGNTLDTRVFQYSGHWNHTFTPELLLDTTVGLMNSRASNVGLSVCFEADGCTNHTVESGIGGMDFGSKFFPGTPAILVNPYAQDFNWASPLKTTARNISFKADLTWIKGRHSIRGGVDFMNQDLFAETPLGARGVFSFNGISTLFANPWPDFVTGVPTVAQRAAPRTRGGSERDSLQFYVQDDFKITPTLTLNLGVRYDYNFAPVPVGAGGAVDVATGKVIFADVDRNGIPNPDFSPSLPILLPLIGEENLISSTEAGLHPSFVNLDKNNFAPRIGLAWKPLKSTVIRAGYGLYYLIDIVGNIATFFSQAPPFSLVEVQNNVNAFFAGRPLTNLSNTYTNLDELTAIPPSWNAVSVNPKTHTPYENQYSFSIQQQLEKDLIFEVMYVGKTSVHLQSTSVVALPASRPAFAPPGATLVTQEANSSYHSLQSRLEKRYSGGLAFLASYTWSKAIDIVSGNLGNPSAPNAQRGLADYDIPHRFVLSATYDLPFGSGRRWLSSSKGLVDAVLGGWQFTAISQYHPIGRPFSLTWQGGNTGPASIPIASRPDRVADGRKDNPTIDEWFDVSAFEPHFKPPDPDNPGSFLPEEGNAGRNILRSPGFALTDIGINKNFYWGPENRYRVQFRAELFNSFNTPNFGVPQGAGALGGGAVQIGTNPNAARISRTAGPVRQVQFALKFYY